MPTTSRHILSFIDGKDYFIGETLSKTLIYKIEHAHPLNSL